MTAHVRTIVFGALTLLAVTACSTAAAGPPSSVPSAVGAQGQDAAVARAQADSARHPYTEADIRFMTDMIGHHAQAMLIAEWAATHDASPAVQRLARRIISSQEDEIVTMQQWLRDRRQSVPDITQLAAGGDAHAMHGDHHATHGSEMPGMITPQQLQQLDAARGREFDRLFLTFMIQHHRGAIAMVDQLFSSHGAGQDETVFKFASDVNVDQVTEIARMQSMLVEVISGSDAP